MNFVLDLILVAICFLIIFISAKRGFVRSVMGFVSKIVALIAAYTFTTPFAEFIKERFFMSPLTGSISAAIRNTVTSGDTFDFSGLSDKIPTILDRYLVDPAVLDSKIESMQKTGEEALSYVSGEIADRVATMISTALAFIIIFFGVCFALWIVTRIIDAVFKLPVLRTANLALGIVFGVCSAALVAIVYSSTVSLLIGALGSVSTEYFGEDVIEKTLIVKFLANKDFLSLAKNIIS